MFNLQWKQQTFLFLLLSNLMLLLIYLILPINIDHAVSHYIQAKGQTGLFHFAIFITKLGSGFFLLPLTIVIGTVLILLYRSFKQAAIISTMTIGTYLLNEWLKMIIKRERPSIFFEVQATGYSFPSGHAMISLVFYGLLLYYIKRQINNDKIRLMFSALVVTFIIMIGLSRIILNVHYLSDVLSGFLFGFIMLEVAILIDSKIR